MQNTRNKGVIAMERLTYLHDDTHQYVVDPTYIELTPDGFVGIAINRLGCFEDILEGIVNRQVQITAELASLRDANRTKTVRFRQLLTEKLTNVQVISLFQHIDGRTM